MGKDYRSKAIFKSAPLDVDDLCSINHLADSLLQHGN